MVWRLSGRPARRDGPSFGRPRYPVPSSTTSSDDARLAPNSLNASGGAAILPELSPPRAPVPATRPTLPADPDTHDTWLTRRTTQASELEPDRGSMKIMMREAAQGAATCLRPEPG
jgi:hypothetical protein